MTGCMNSLLANERQDNVGADLSRPAPLCISHKRSVRRRGTLPGRQVIMHSKSRFIGPNTHQELMRQRRTTRYERCASLADLVPSWERLSKEPKLHMSPGWPERGRKDRPVMLSEAKRRIYVSIERDPSIRSG